MDAFFSLIISLNPAPNKGITMNTEKHYTVPLESRYAMTVEAAAVYFGIGQKKIRRLAEENPHAGFALTNGNRLLIKRRAFESFLDNLDSV